MNHLIGQAREAKEGSEVSLGPALGIAPLHPERLSSVQNNSAPGDQTVAGGRPVTGVGKERCALVQVWPGLRPQTTILEASVCGPHWNCGRCEEPRRSE